MKKLRTNRAADAPATVDNSLLLSLVGYNTRRVTVKVFELFARRLANLSLSPVDFSVLALIGHNPGLMPSQLTAELALLPPNLTRILARLDQRQLLLRMPAAADKRAVCLSLTDDGLRLLAEAQQHVVALEHEASQMLTDKQRQTLLQLLQKIYL